VCVPPSYFDDMWSRVEVGRCILLRKILIIHHLSNWLFTLVTKPVRLSRRKLRMISYEMSSKWTVVQLGLLIHTGCIVQKEFTLFLLNFCSETAKEDKVPQFDVFTLPYTVYKLIRFHILGWKLRFCVVVCDWIKNFPSVAWHVICSVYL
jgi:hypothetical protein